MTNGAWAIAILEEVPANALIGLRIKAITPVGAEVSLPDDPRVRNPYGAVQAGPLLGLLDAAALAAIMGQLHPEELATVTAVAKTAALEFLAPARGSLTGVSSLAAASAEQVRALVAGPGGRLDLNTDAEARNDEGTVVARAGFHWVIRHRP
jgi:acyl-coenzyme A thioesterase PaaI-like protein